MGRKSLVECPLDGYKEARPLPLRCRVCISPDCGSCDYALERWIPTKKYELTIQLKAKLKQVERLNNQIEMLKKQIEELEEDES